MPKICYIDKSFHNSSLIVIKQANEIIDDLGAQGYTLTLRQLYYQFVAKGWLKNTTRNYHRLGNIINDGRLAGLVDWNALVDRTRNLVTNSHWSNPASIIDSCVDSYAIDKWEDQKNRVEIWIEKEALSGIVQPICERLDIPFFACRGYVSQSEMWRHACRLNDFKKIGQDPIIIHLGDHDPSGIDMTRDIFDRMEQFGVHGLRVNRIALNWNQVEQYNPPPNPAKMTDSRFASYYNNYGDKSWELDALRPQVIENLIIEEVCKYQDVEKYDALKIEEEEGRKQLAEIRDNLNA